MINEDVSARVIVHGRVQGVGFRYFTLRTADRLGVTGTVANKYQGTVEVRCAGSRERLDNFILCLRSGPANSEVSGVDVDWDSEPLRYTGFSIAFA